MKTVSKIMMPMIPVMVLISLMLSNQFKNILPFVGGIGYTLLAIATYFKYNKFEEAEDTLTIEEEEEADSTY